MKGGVDCTSSDTMFESDQNKTTNSTRSTGKRFGKAMECIRDGDVSMLREALKCEPTSNALIAQVFTAPASSWAALLDVLLEHDTQHTFTNEKGGVTFLPTYILSTYAHEIERDTLDELLSMTIKHVRFEEEHVCIQPFWRHFITPCIQFNLIRTIDACLANSPYRCSATSVPYTYRTIVRDMLTHKYRYNQYAVFEQQFHRLSSAGVALDEHVPTEDDGFGVDIVYPLLLASTLRMKALLRFFTYDVQSCRLLDAAFQGAFDRRSVLNTMFWYSPDVTSRLNFFGSGHHGGAGALRRDVARSPHDRKARDFVALHQISRSRPTFADRGVPHCL